jgi:hypothetical protein
MDSTTLPPRRPPAILWIVALALCTPMAVLMTLGLLQLLHTGLLAAY